MGKLLYKNLYQDNNYFDEDIIFKNDFIYNWVIGARNIGKTFNVLKHLFLADETFIFMRRTETQARKASNKNVGDIAKVMKYLNIYERYKWGKIEDTIAIYKINDDDSLDLKILVSSVKGVGKVTGIDLEPFNYIVFDEFIGIPTDNAIRGEGSAIDTVMETANRSKELNGLNPPRFIGLANSYNINNVHFMSFGLIEGAEDLKFKSDDEFKEVKDEHFLIIPKHSKIAELKADTRSGRAHSDEYNDMSIHNNFIMNDFTYIRKQNLKEYQCVINVGLLYVYAHKTDYKFYVCRNKGRCNREHVYPTTITGLERFRRTQYRLWSAYLDGYIYFDKYDSLAKFESYFNNRI